MQISIWTEWVCAGRRKRLCDFGVVSPLVPCCEAMACQWDVSVGLFREGKTAGRADIRVGFSVTTIDTAGSPLHGSVAIHNCPWCGEKIVLIDAETENGIPAPSMNGGGR